jgi:hypothetical protein
MLKESLDKSSREEKGEFNAGFVYFNSFRPEFGRWTAGALTQLRLPAGSEAGNAPVIKTMHMYQFSKSKNEQSAIKLRFHTVSLKRGNLSHG